jgi:exodeoxyribonuclease VII large subunit
VGLITSYGSDAYNDFVSELERSGFAFEVTVHDCIMQGKELKGRILKALSYFVERASQFDVIAIIRGGGSRSDLAWFDDLQVALAVATCPLKVISGIGHTRDVSVIDLITHSEKTPTAAAAVLVVQVQQTSEYLFEVWRQIREGASSEVLEERERLGSLAGSLERAIRSELVSAKRYLEDRKERMVSLLVTWRRRAGERVQRGLARLVSTARAHLRLANKELSRLRSRLSLERLERVFERKEGRLLERERRCDLLNPSRLLLRGYAIVFREGSVLKRARDVERGDPIEVRLQDGEISAVVSSKSHPRGDSHE